MDDLEALHSICSDHDVMRYVGDGQPWTLAATRAFIDGAMARWERLGYCRWPVIHAADSRLIGFCGFIESGDGAEMGWRLAADYWGRGLATEAARAVLKHGFETFRFQRVSATVQAANRASLRVVEKLGMHPERSFQRNGREIIAFAVEQRGKRPD